MPVCYQKLILTALRSRAGFVQTFFLPLLQLSHLRMLLPNTGRPHCVNCQKGGNVEAGNF